MSEIQLIKSSDTVRKRAAFISLVASVVIFSLKLFAYRMTGSTAVLSDAMESIVNVVASIVALFVVRFASQPADSAHPYGHGKAESFSSTFEGGMIVIAGLMIIREAVNSLFEGPQTHGLEKGVYVVAVAAALNAILGFYLKSTGKKHQSEALRASGAHVLSDVYTTVGVIVGLVLVIFTGISWIDPAIAIVLGFMLIYQGYKIVREALGVLLDEQDMSVVESLASSMQKFRFNGLIDIHHLRVIRAGRFHHVDAHMVVPEFWNVAETHAIIHSYEEKVVADHGFDGELAFHLDPCKKSYCRVCDLPQCPIRQEAFEEAIFFSVKSLTEGPHPTNQGAYDSANN